MRSILLFLVLTASATAAPTVEQVQNSLRDVVIPLLGQSCIDCHDSDLAKGDIDFAKLSTPGNERLDIRLWLKVREQLRAGTMPPANKTPISDADKQALLSWIDQNEQALANAPVGEPGTARTRRLNREEYSNTVRDLFGIQSRPGDKFPTDGSGGEGFNNNADTLSISPLLVEKHFIAAGEVIDEVWSNNTLRSRLLAPVYSDKLPGDLGGDLALRPFLLRALRHIPSEDTVQKHLNILRAVLKSGGNWDDAMKAMFKSVLISPQFIFLEEAPAPDAKPRRLNHFETATRLSYFLWSTTPDDELLSLAVQQKLHDPAVLTQQTRRLLAHPNAKAFVKNFAGQWLRFEDIHDKATPDPRKFPGFNGKVRLALYNEIFHYLENILLKNGNVLELLDSNYTYLNQTLATHYGIPDVQGEEFRQVKFTDNKRGGLTTMGGFLALTSYPQRTSPVLRGKWVLEQLMGTPPPPPPPNVGGLPEDDRNLKEGTLRQRLEAHRDKPACIGCHVRLDPPGFALENFSPTGQWRDNENGKPLDTSGDMPGNRPFTTPAEFRKILMHDKDLFVRSLTTRLLGYSLDRGLEVQDQPTLLRLEKILRDNHYHIEPLIIAVTQSHPFLWRK
jgi:hypothetical protein